MSGLYLKGNRTGAYKPAFHSEEPIFVRQLGQDERTSVITEDKQKQPAETNQQAETTS